MFQALSELYRRAHEIDALSLLAHPRVVANYFQHQWEAQQRPLVMRSQPTAIEIELTNRCNLACIQCLRSQGLKPYALGDIGFDDYQRILAQFPYVVNLCLNGFGEPLMHERFFDVVAYSRKERPWAKIGIYSNGMLLDEARVERLVGSGLTEINVSIDAAEPETYRRVRRGGRLEVVHAGIRRLLRVRRAAGQRFPLVGTNFVMLEANQGELIRFIEQSADLGADYVNCITYATYDWGIENRRPAGSYRLEVDAARARLGQLGLHARSLPSDDLSWSDPRRPFDCGFFWGQSVRITHEGELTLGCCTPFKEIYTYGNLLQTPFRELWNNARQRHNRACTLGQRPPTAACASCDRFARSFFAPRPPAEGASPPGRRLPIQN